MIFVSVGTHEQPFNRLIQYIDNMKRDDRIQEEVIMQIGFSTYVPQYCKWSRLIPYSQMEQNVADARIIITHGGPASFIMPLQIGKTPIVVPRLRKYGEHVNNHQLDFTRAVAERQKNIIVVEEIEDLINTIISYENLLDSMSCRISSNNQRFNVMLGELVEKVIS